MPMKNIILLTVLCFPILVNTQTITLAFEPVYGATPNPSEIKVSGNTLYIDKLRSLDLENMEEGWKVFNVPVKRYADNIHLHVHNDHHYVGTYYEQGTSLWTHSEGASYFGLVSHDTSIQDLYSLNVQYLNGYGGFGASHYSGSHIIDYDYRFLNDSLIYLYINKSIGLGHDGSEIVDDFFVIKNNDTFNRKSSQLFPAKLITDNEYYINVVADSIQVSDNTQFTNYVTKFIPEYSDYIDGFLEEDVLSVFSKDSVLLSYDLGDSWEEMSYPFTEEINQVTYNKENQAYHLFTQDKVYQCQDLLDPSCYEVLYDFQENPYGEEAVSLFVSKENRWITKQDTVKYSSDFGQTWLKLENIPWTSNNDLFAVGDELWISNTTRSFDKGETWSEIPSNSFRTSTNQMLTLNPRNNLCKVNDVYFAMAKEENENFAIYSSANDFQAFEKILEIPTIPIVLNESIYTCYQNTLYKYQFENNTWITTNLDFISGGTVKFYSLQNYLILFEQLDDQEYNYFISVDDGLTWVALELPNDESILHPMLVGDHFLYLYNKEGGIWSKEPTAEWKQESIRNDANLDLIYGDVLLENHLFGTFTVGDIIFQDFYRKEFRDDYHDILNATKTFTECFISPNKGRDWFRVEVRLIGRWQPIAGIGRPQCEIGNTVFFKGAWKLNKNAFVDNQRPDIKITNLDIIDGHLLEFDTSYYEFTITNIFPETITDSFDIDVVLFRGFETSVDTIRHHRIRIPGLESYETLTLIDSFIFPHEYPYVYHYLEVNVDEEDLIDEFYEDNNSLGRNVIMRSKPIVYTSEEVIVCEGDLYNGVLYLDDIVLIDTISTHLDSIEVYRLIINVVKPDNIFTQEFICKGDSILFGGDYLYEPAFYKDTLIGLETGCDSVVTMQIIHLPDIYKVESIDILQGETFNGVQITSDTVFQNTFITQNGCDSTHIVVVNVIPSTSVNDISTSLFSLFPNPTSNQFTISTNRQEYTEVDYQVIDVYGRILQKGTFLSSEIKLLSLEKEEKGLYFIQLEFEEKRYVEKIVKQ